MHRCEYCYATFSVYSDKVLHRQRFHWNDYLDGEKPRNFELLAAEGMTGLWAGADKDG